MTDDYGKRVIRHYKIQQKVLWTLMNVAQELCPDDEWVFQMFAHSEYISKTGEIKPKFMAVVTNGDDNTTAVAENAGAAVALLIHYLLDGSVFPLTGNGGKKVFPADCGWVRSKEEVLDGQE